MKLSPKEAALMSLSHVHGNRKVEKPKPVDYDALFDAVKRTAPTFSVEMLRHNTALKKSSFREAFGQLHKQEQFPFNLHDAFAEAYSAPKLPNCAPWRDYLYTMAEAIQIYQAATGRSAASFRAACVDGEVTHYRFNKCVRRFRREDLETYLRSCRNKRFLACVSNHASKETV